MAKRKKPGAEDSAGAQPPRNDDENFGLPELDPKPIERTESEEVITAEATTAAQDPAPAEFPRPLPPESSQPGPPKEPYRTTYSEPEPERSPASLIFIILLVVVLAGGGIWYFMMYKPKKEKEAAARELALKQAEEKRKKEEAEKLRLAEEERLKREAEAAQPKEGSFQIVEERTGRYYVIVATAIDDDLLQDYAKKLSATGISSKMIPPFGKTKFYRLAIDDQDSWDAAQAKADGLKTQYGDAVWVLKY
jgi:cbb3-type cytochrome oxidase subunit 3